MRAPLKARAQRKGPKRWRAGGVHTQLVMGNIFSHLESANFTSWQQPLGPVYSSVQPTGPGKPSACRAPGAGSVDTRNFHCFSWAPLDAADGAQGAPFALAAAAQSEGRPAGRREASAVEATNKWRPNYYALHNNLSPSREPLSLARPRACLQLRGRPSQHICAPLMSGRGSCRSIARPGRVVRRLAPASARAPARPGPARAEEFRPSRPLAAARVAARWRRRRRRRRRPCCNSVRSADVRRPPAGVTRPAELREARASGCCHLSLSAD